MIFIKNLFCLPVIWTIFFMFKNLQNQLIQSIRTDKLKYFNKISKRLCDRLISTKCYWSLLSGNKVPCIPPIFHNNKCVTDFKEKSEIFNSFFAPFYQLRSKPLIHQRDFHLKYILDILLLHVV